jgi:hypothetical protein
MSSAGVVLEVPLTLYILHKNGLVKGGTDTPRPSILGTLTAVLLFYLWDYTI